MHTIALSLATSLWLSDAPVITAVPTAPVAPAAQAKAPRDVWDCYVVLTHDNVLKPVLARKGGAISYEAEVDETYCQGRGPAVLDIRNGYMAYEYYLGVGGDKVELALFTTADNRRFLGVNTSSHTGRAEYSEFHFFAFDGGKSRDVTQEVGLPGSLTVKDFLDEKYVMPPRSEEDGVAFGVEDIVMVTVHLPREGTTVSVTLEPTQFPKLVIDGGRRLRQAKEELAKHRKYQTIEFAWSKTEGKFTVARKK
jgi:hypothetical protein